MARTIRYDNINTIPALTWNWLRLNRATLTSDVTAFGGNLGVNNEALACAMSWILFLIIGALTLVMFKTNKWVKYSDE